MLEVTESALMDDAEAALLVLNELKSLGVRIAIDDFGIGYSSLVYLKRFPVDLLKVDRSFVGGLGTNKDDAAIVHSVIELAHAFGIAAVAEGIETRRAARHAAGPRVRVRAGLPVEPGRAAPATSHRRCSGPAGTAWPHRDCPEPRLGRRSSGEGDPHGGVEDWDGGVSRPPRCRRSASPHPT